jgi:hypothetical protein
MNTYADDTGARAFFVVVRVLPDGGCRHGAAAAQLRRSACTSTWNEAIVS